MKNDVMASLATLSITELGTQHGFPLMGYCCIGRYQRVLMPVSWSLFAPVSSEMEQVSDEIIRALKRSIYSEPMRKKRKR